MPQMVDDLRNIMLLGVNCLEEEFSKKVFKMMVEAVHFCHQNNVVHRDIKLENFLIDIDLQSEKIDVKLIDFGLSKILSKGMVLNGTAGTLITMAPEVLKG